MVTCSSSQENADGAANRPEHDGTTEMVVLKVHPGPEGTWVKDVVNIYTVEEEHFGKQSIQIKRLIKRFKPEICVVDGMGLGVGLVDFLTADQQDPDTGDMLYNLGVWNDDDHLYRKMQTPDTVRDMLYIMKADMSLNSELYAYTQSQLLSNSVKFLVDESVAKNDLMADPNSKKMTPEQRADHLRPFVETSILKSQLANLIRDEGRGSTIVLKPHNSKIPKDKVSAFVYALFWCKMQEDRKRRKKGFDIHDFMMFSKGK